MPVTAAIILTDSSQMETAYVYKEPTAIHLIKELKPHFKEIIMISEKPSYYLPYVRDSVRILSPFHKGKEPLSSLHACLSLAYSRDVWLLHENEHFPGYHAFRKMKKFQNKTGVPCVVYHKDRKNLLYSIINKRVLPSLEELLRQEKQDIDCFLKRISYLTYSAEK
jgi:molybdenum cofactor guanylyltransferase